MIKVVCYTHLAATTIFLNVIERKYKRQIFPPDPIILGLNCESTSRQIQLGEDHSRGVGAFLVIGKTDGSFSALLCTLN